MHLYFTTIQRNCFCSVIDLNVVHRMVFQRNVNKVRMDILLKFDVFEVCHNAEIQMIDLFRQVFTSKYLPIYQFIYFLHKAIFLHVTLCIFFLLKYILVFSFLRIVSLTQWIYIELYIKLRFWRSSCNMRFIFLRVYPFTSQQHIVYLKLVSYIYGNKKSIPWKHN